nr:hypothetical protein [Tanacetum cinerariifolium]
LDNLIESQRSDRVKEGVGYNVVPPPAADLYLFPKKDLSWTGLPEFVDGTVTDYRKGLKGIQLGLKSMLMRVFHTDLVLTDHMVLL